jgi:SNF2 family DNA or RNA helicase
LDFESEEEKEIYKNFFDESYEKIQYYKERGSIKSNYAYILLMLLRLRQLCDHPFLTLHKSDKIVECKICTDIIDNLVEIDCGHQFCKIFLITLQVVKIIFKIKMNVLEENMMKEIKIAHFVIN